MGILRFFLGFSVFAALSVKLGIYGGLPRGGLAWSMLAVVVGYLAYTLLQGRLVSYAFGLILICFAVYLNMYYGYVLPPLLLLLGGSLVVLNPSGDGSAG